MSNNSEDTYMYYILVWYISVSKNGCLGFVSVLALACQGSQASCKDCREEDALPAAVSQGD